MASKRLIAGLGNPGTPYEGTRHNVGFEVVRELARRRGLVLEKSECSSLVAEDEAVLLVLPQTYMNRSGYALRCFAELRGLAPADMLVVYDEVHLPLGKLRLRPSGSPAGHRGLESILENLSTAEVPRLRLGVAGEPPPPPEALRDFVLAPFDPAEKTAVETLVERAADACLCWLEEGAERAMARFNG